MKHRISQLFSQRLSRHNVDFPSEFFLKEQTETYQIQQVGVFLKIDKNINIAFLALLAPNNRSENTDFPHLVLHEMVVKRFDGIYDFVFGIHDLS